MLRLLLTGAVLVGAVLSTQPVSTLDHHAVHVVPVAPSDSGTLTPAGPPVSAPTRTNAGASCIVDLTQRYTFSGTLSGTTEIDYRILVAGPCGAPPGTYAEEWIAHGEFKGEVRGSPAVGRFTYRAHVDVGGQVEGRMVFGQGMQGELEVWGNFSDGRLTYSGSLD